MQALAGNKLRTFLSLLGITIGIFAIVSVFTVVDSIKRNIDGSLASMGENVIYIQKWPWSFSNDYPWWSYMGRPVTRYGELNDIRSRSELSDVSAFIIQAEGTLKYEASVAEYVKISAVSDGYERIKSFELATGRYFTEAELRSGKNYIVIGNEVARLLFGVVDPVGKSILLKGDRVQVIGVFKREGENIIDMGLDNAAIMPINFARGRIAINTDQVNPHIQVKAKAGITNEQLKDELTGIMRGIRRLSPRERDNFSLNETRLISNGFEQMKGVLYLTGGIIGFFSILVGGFGIANIMFVSVKERTHIIGIQKSLGAKNYFILFEFLFEAVLLSVIGGLIGLLLIFLLSFGLSSLLDFSVSMSMENIVLGIVISSVIGLISGLAPAISASRLNPVEAIRAK